MNIFAIYKFHFLFIIHNRMSLPNFSLPIQELVVGTEVTLSLVRRNTGHGNLWRFRLIHQVVLPFLETFIMRKGQLHLLHFRNPFFSEYWWEQDAPFISITLILIILMIVTYLDLIIAIIILQLLKLAYIIFFTFLISLFIDQLCNR